MTREEAVAIARSFPIGAEWVLLAEEARFEESLPYHYQAFDARPYWVIPLCRDQERFPYVGSSRVLLVSPMSGEAKMVAYGE